MILLTCGFAEGMAQALARVSARLHSRVLRVGTSSLPMYTPSRQRLQYPYPCHSEGTRPEFRAPGFGMVQPWLWWPSGRTICPCVSLCFTMKGGEGGVTGSRWAGLLSAFKGHSVSVAVQEFCGQW